MCLVLFWNDEVDRGSLTFDTDGCTDAYYDDTIAFIKSCMQPELIFPRPAPSRLYHSGCFIDIGAAMQDQQTKADRDRFVAALVAEANTVRAN